MQTTETVCAVFYDYIKISSPSFDVYGLQSSRSMRTNIFFCTLLAPDEQPDIRHLPSMGVAGRHRLRDCER